jgi:hypothetical protein
LPRILSVGEQIGRILSAAVRINSEFGWIPLRVGLGDRVRILKDVVESFLYSLADEGITVVEECTES